MKNNTKYCQKCGAEIADSKQKVCTECGAKISKPIYKKWWFWLVIVLVIAVAGASASGDSGSSSNGDSGETTEIADNAGSSSAENKYEVVDLQKMLDDLEENALRAENMYQNKYVQVQGKIASFDSDGAYITIEPVNADEWNFDTVMCYIKNDSQRDFLLNKSKGDTVTIKGKIITIGEFLGYSINIDEVN